MSKQDTHLALLPSGFVDLLPPEAEQELQAIGTLMQKFSAFGYERIKPPLVEFEDSLLAPGPGASLSHETFRLMDPVTHRMMGIRSDITPQTARIASSRLAGEARPLRLAYANDVLRTKSGQQRTERQFCQVGCELIGAQGLEAEIESCVVALVGLKALGLESLTIDLTIPQLARKLFDGFDVAESERSGIEAAIGRREYDGVAKVAGPLSDVLSGLIGAAGEAGSALKAIADINLPGSLSDDVQNLQSVYDGLKKALGELKMSDVAIAIDPLESKGFEYHSTIGFTLFAKDVRGELGRGGRYDVRFGDEGEGETATGFTLYMDTIRKALPALEPTEKVFVPAGEGWDVMRSLQEEGRIVVRGSAGDSSPGKCTHIYKDGKVEEI